MLSNDHTTSYRSNILIVDDDPDVVRLMRIVLEDAGHTVLTAPDGESALSACTRFNRLIHVLIVDVVLPGMLGTDLAWQLLSRYPYLSVIFMTGYPFKQIAADIAPVPHDLLLMKPIRIGALVSDVEGVLIASGNQ